MPASTLRCVAGDGDTSMSFCMLIGTTGRQGAREMIPFGSGEPAPQVLRSAGFYLTTTNPPTVLLSSFGIFELPLGIWEVGVFLWI